MNKKYHQLDSEVQRKGAALSGDPTGKEEEIAISKAGILEILHRFSDEMNAKTSNAPGFHRGLGLRFALESRVEGGSIVRIGGNYALVCAGERELDPVRGWVTVFDGVREEFFGGKGESIRVREIETVFFRKSINVSNEVRELCQLRAEAKRRLG